MIRLTVTALVAAALVAVSVSVVFAESPGTITQLSGDAGCFTETGTDGGTGTCTVGRLLEEQMSLVMTPDGRFVYSMASGSDHGGGAVEVQGISVFSRDAATGALTQLPGAEGCVSNDGTDGRGGVCTQVSAILSAKAAGISPDGKNLYLGGEQGLLGFTINQTTGALTQDAGCLNDGGTGGCSAAVGVNEAVGVLVSRDGKTVYVSGSTATGVNATPDAVATLSRDPDTGVLMQLPLPAGCIADSPGSDAAGCRHATALYEPLDLVESPQHDQVYVAVSEGINRNVATGNVEFGSVSVMSRDATDGSLTQIDCNGENAAAPPSGTGCASNAWGLADATSIAISPDGRSVYVGAQGSYSPSPPGTVVAFSRDAATGKLTQVQCMSGNGADGRKGPFSCDTVPSIIEPTDIAVSRDGGTFYAASSDSSGPAIFSRDSSTSKLTQLPGTDGCVRTDGLNGCATGRASWANSVVIAPGCDFVYFGGHDDSGTDSSLTVFRRTPDCTPTSSAAVGACTSSGDVVISVVDRGNGTGAKKVHYRLENGAEQIATTSAGATGTATVTVPEGKHSLEFWAEDEAHAIEKTHHTVSVVVDKTNPTVTVASDQHKSSHAFGERASVTTTAADENSGVKDDPSGAGQSIPTNKPGKNSVTRTATDACGNSASATFTYDVAQALVAAARTKTMRLSVTPRVVYAGERMRFDFKAYNPARAASAARNGFASARGPVKSATIRFAGHRLRTDSRGRAHITLALRRGRYKAQATRTGYRPASSSVRARKRPAVLVPQFTG
jgi:hypothetical protein